MWGTRAEAHANRSEKTSTQRRSTRASRRDRPRRLHQRPLHQGPTLRLDTVANRFLATFDANRDGLDDVIVGGATLPDLAVFDAGDPDAGEPPQGGYIGGEPQLLIGTADGTWHRSAALTDAVAATPDGYCWKACGTTLHLKHVTAGYIDGNCTLDLYVESGGGFDNPAPHVLLGDGSGAFTLDATDERRVDRVIWGDTGAWRYASQTLADLDSDGDL